MTPQVLKVNVPAVFVRQFEVRRNGVQRQHRQILADLECSLRRARDEVERWIDELCASGAGVWLWWYAWCPAGRPVSVIDDFAKEYLHSDLRDVRETMLWKLEGLSEYDVRRPLTYTGTNLGRPMSRASTSSTATGERGSTLTRRSPSLTSTRLATCPGGHART